MSSKFFKNSRLKKTDDYEILSESSDNSSRKSSRLRLFSTYYAMPYKYINLINMQSFIVSNYCKLFTNYCFSNNKMAYRKKKNLTLIISLSHLDQILSAEFLSKCFKLFGGKS